MAQDTDYTQPGRTPLEIGGGEQFSQLVQSTDGTEFPQRDWRARIRPKKGGEKFAYGLVDPDDPTKEITDSVLKPLQDRGGIVYPYTPDIFLQASVDYNEAMQHGSNYPFYTYINSRPTTLPITGVFTANTIEEGQYMLAVFHFLRSVTKAYYGDSAVKDGFYGTPPPVLLFEYLGEFGFNKVPVIIRNYNFQLPPDVDYVPVKYKGTTTMMPTETSVMIELAPQYTYRKTRKKFNLQAFTSGRQLKDGFI
jgi:hypothetical protein